MIQEKRETIGTIFNIQRFSLHDGPGIRTTVFLSGCPLRCEWCHNPEGFTMEPRLRYLPKCIHCGKCVAVCEKAVHTFQDGVHEVEFNRCVFCGKCIAVCPSGALIASGERIRAQELVEKLLKDKPYFGKDGGVTFSGGEPLVQADFLVECMRLLRANGVGCAVDTSGEVPFENLQRAVEYADIFLYDIKAYTETLHIKGTGVSNQRILKNLQKLDSLGKRLYIRIPVIPRINATKEEMQNIARFVSTLKNVQEIKLLPYHTFGREKYPTLGLRIPEEKESVDSQILDFQKIFKF